MTICKNIRTVGERIRQAEQRYGRVENSVRLLAVSKYHPITALQAALQCQQYAFGENYVQEMIEKSTLLAQEKIEWHFIGALQANKTRQVAERADWVHTIDRFKIAKRLSEQRPAHLPALNICLQVNLSQEASKSGVALAAVEELARQVQTLSQIRLRGLMAIPAPDNDFSRQRAVFAQLRECKAQLNMQGLMLDTLSMGMTDDMEAAIAEGATIVRIGTAIFGQRP